MISALLVDDEPQLLEIGKLFLERSGNLTVDTSLSGHHAIEMLKYRKYDVIISDYEMPQMDGIELLQIIRTHYDKIPFILFTGRGREEVVIKALNSGADSYLQKGGGVKAQFVELENIVKMHVERRKAEIALEKSEKKYRLLVDNAQEGIFVLQNELLVFYNQKFTDMLQNAGVFSSDIETQPIFNVLHPDYQEIMRDRYYHRMKTGESLDKSPFKMTDKQGSVHWFEIDAVITEWNDSPATLNFLRDITEKHKLKILINENENRYLELLDSLPKTVLELDENLNLTFINKTGIDKFGYTIEDINRPLKVTDLVIESDRKKILTHMISMNDGDNLRHREYTAQKKNGDTVPMKTYINPIYRDNSFAGYRAVCVDISEEKLAKSALAQANKQLNLMTKVTRHDILNEITALHAFQEISQELADDPTLIEYLKKQIQITKKIQAYIEFTRYYQNIGVETPRWQDIRKLIDSAISDNNTKSISIEVKFKNCLVYADPLLQVVFANIIENSIRHGDHVTKIRFRVVDTGETLTIWYTDNGIGIPHELKERIFDEGFGNHTGFGLFLIREILSLTGIAIRENGTDGNGAQFEIIVPKGAYIYESDTLIVSSKRL